MLALSGVTDCYQPVEKKAQLTRGCLEVLLEFRNPVVIVTKNYLVTRDIDILARTCALPVHRRYDFVYDVGSQIVLVDGTTRIKSDASLGRHRRTRGCWNSSGLPASADDPWAYRLRSAGHRSSRGRSRRDFCGLCRFAFAVCSEDRCSSNGWSSIFPNGKKKFSTGFAPFAVASSTTRISKAACAARGFSPSRWQSCFS